MNPIDFLVKFFNTFDEGKIFLPAGTHAHKIYTKSTPLNVWIAEDKCGDLPVCNGGVNLYGYTLDEDGFIFYAEIVSDTASFCWQAELEQ